MFNKIKELNQYIQNKLSHSQKQESKKFPTLAFSRSRNQPGLVEDFSFAHFTFTLCLELQSSLKTFIP